MTADHLLRGLDAAQREAVTTEAAPLAIVAAAGSGKTTVLTRRIAYRIATESAHPQHVLALTFTRDAAGELRRRLRTLDIREHVEAGTFHSIALRLLRDRALSRNESAPSVAGDRVRLMREALTSISLKVDPFLAMTDLDWARARLLDPERYEGACRLERRRSAVPASRLGEVATAYADTKRRRGVVDFDDLLQQVLQGLRTDTAWADAVRWRFRHVFVDEAQDLNPLQAALLDALVDGRPDMCLVGDPRQAIYGWNGADHTVFAEVERRYPGVTVISLSRNHRCAPTVVAAAASALRAAGLTDDSTSGDERGMGVVTVTSLENEHAEVAETVTRIRAWMQRHEPDDLAVLARTNEQLVPVEEALRRAGIPVARGAGRSALDLALAPAFRCTSKEQLGRWVDEVLGVDSPTASDELSRRVAAAADRFLCSGETGSFRSWVDATNPFPDLEHHHEAAVSLLTFHAAKGREWWGVVVNGVEERLVPHSSAVTAAQLAEEARLLYVAITRGAQEVVLTHCANRNTLVAHPSRWLDAVSEVAASNPPVPPPDELRKAWTAPADPLVPYREWRRAVARVSGIDDLAVCTDSVLRSLHDDPPADTLELARRLGITPTSAERLRPLPGR
ncbi:MAG: ATP-dependent helicase [Ilumatobacteraceae bacterium]